MTAVIAWERRGGDGACSLRLPRLPLARELLRLGDLRAGHAPCNELSAFHRLLATLRHRDRRPHVREDEIPRHPLALPIHVSEIVLGESVAVVSREAIPLRRLSMVLRDAPAV